MNSQHLLSELISQTQDHISRVQIFLEKDQKFLHKKMENNWSSLECFEHLNLYFEYYLPVIATHLEQSKDHPKENFYSGMLGNYFANSVKPKVGMKKMSSPKAHNPSGKNITEETIYRLIANMNVLISLLEKSKRKNLEKIKIQVAVAKFLRIRLGDCFRFLVFHNERHLQQAERIE